MADLSNDILSQPAKRRRGVICDTDIPVAYLRECFDLDPSTPSGVRWKHRPVEHFVGGGKRGAQWACNSRNIKFAGEPAGSRHPRGRWLVGFRINGKPRSVYAHRIIYAITKGHWPPDQVDHKDRNKAANQIENLREATNAQNQQNTNLQASNTSGFKGVHWHQPAGKWAARITVDGRRIHLGYFDDILDAIMARQNAEQELHPFHVRPRLDADIFTLPLDLPVEVIEEWKREVPRGLWQLPPRIHLPVERTRNERGQFALRRKAA